MERVALLPLDALTSASDAQFCAAVKTLSTRHAHERVLCDQTVLCNHCANIGLPMQARSAANGGYKAALSVPTFTFKPDGVCAQVGTSLEAYTQFRLQLQRVERGTNSIHLVPQ